MRITLDESLVKAIKHYIDTDWSKHDSIAPLNAVAYIGERVAAIVARRARVKS